VTVNGKGLKVILTTPVWSRGQETEAPEYYQWLLNVLYVI